MFNNFTLYENVRITLLILGEFSVAMFFYNLFVISGLFVIIFNELFP